MINIADLPCVQALQKPSGQDEKSADAEAQPAPQYARAPEGNGHEAALKGTR